MFGAPILAALAKPQQTQLKRATLRQRSLHALGCHECITTSQMKIFLFSGSQQINFLPGLGPEPGE